MKTIQERIKDCAICKNQMFDPQKGIVCSLTKEKPAFEESCPTFLKDDLLASKAADKCKPDSVASHMWLLYFLLVCVGGNAVLSIILFIENIAKLGYSLVESLFLGLPTILLVIIAGMTIFAFFARKSNAVSLAITFVTQILLIDIFSIIYCLETDTYSWDCIWSIFITIIFYFVIIKAQTIQDLFPKQSRTWRMFEKIVLVVYSFIFLISVMVVYLDTAQIINNLVEEAQKELPVECGDNTKITQISKIEDCVVYTCQINDVYVEEYPVPFWNVSQYVEKYTLLNKVKHNEEMDQLFIQSIAHGLSVKLEYIDANGTVIYSFTISPEIYKEAQSQRNKPRAHICSDKDLNMAISEYKKLLPIAYMRNSTLTNIELSKKHDNSLVYYIQLPKMSQTDMQELSKPYLKKYICENWQSFIDPMIQLAKLNDMTIHFIFKDFDGHTHADVSIDLWYNIYHQKLYL